MVIPNNYKYNITRVTDECRNRLPGSGSLAKQENGPQLISRARVPNI